MSEDMEQIKMDFYEDMNAAVERAWRKLRREKRYNADDAAAILEAWFDKYSNV